MNPIMKAGIPTIDSLPSGMRRNDEAQFLSSWEKKEIDNAMWATVFFKENAQVIVMPFTLQNLAEKRVVVKNLEKECKKMQLLDAQVMSAIFVDKEGQPILAYCASRPDTQVPKIQVSCLYVFIILSFSSHALLLVGQKYSVPGKNTSGPRPTYRQVSYNSL